jgi:hypothetical protein
VAGFLDRAWMTISGAPGTGDVALDAAFSTAYNTFAEGGATNGMKLRVVFEEGNDFELSEVTYSTTGPSLTGRTVLRSKIAGVAGTTKMNLMAAASVFAVPAAVDLLSMTEIRTANQVLASPNGVAGVPAFRSLVSADIPVLDTSKITSGTFGPARIDLTASYNWTGAHNFTRTGGAGAQAVNVVATAPGSILDTTGGKGGTQFFASTGDSFVAFHISGLYATYFGVRQGQQGFWYGGWSEGNAAYQFHDTKGNGAASQADQEAGTNSVKYVAPGFQQFHPSAAKVWCVFNGTGTPAILAGHNVSSITDRGTGKFTVNYSVTMSSANHCSLWSAAKYDSNDDGNFTTTAGTTTVVPTATSSPVTTGTAAVSGLQDPPRVNFAAYGDLA